MLHLPVSHLEAHRPQSFTVSQWRWTPSLAVCPCRVCSSRMMMMMILSESNRASVCT